MNGKNGDFSKNTGSVQYKLTIASANWSPPEGHPVREPK
jgi:hypothetical protein